MNPIKSPIYAEINQGERIEVRPLSAVDFLRYFKALAKHTRPDGSADMAGIAAAAIDNIDWLWQASTGLSPALLKTYSLDDLVIFFAAFREANFPDGVEKKMTAAQSIIRSICGERSEPSLPTSSS